MKIWISVSTGVPAQTLDLAAAVITAMDRGMYLKPSAFGSEIRLYSHDDKAVRTYRDHDEAAHHILKNLGCPDDSNVVKNFNHWRSRIDVLGRNAITAKWPVLKPLFH